MALLMDFYLPAGTNLASIIGDNVTDVIIKSESYKIGNGYITVGNIAGNKEELTFKLFYRKDKEGEILDFKELKFTPSQDDNSERWDKQAYEYTKSLPEFSKAIDVLDE